MSLSELELVALEELKRLPDRYPYWSDRPEKWLPGSDDDVRPIHRLLHDKGLIKIRVYEGPGSTPMVYAEILSPDSTKE